MTSIPASVLRSMRSLCIGRSGKAAPGQATPLHRWRSSLRADYPAMLGLVARRRTHCANCVRSVQTSATSQSTIRAARGATSPALLGAIEALRGLSGRAFAKRRWVFSTRRHHRRARWAVSAGGDLGGGEERRASVGARSALRVLTRRGCLSGANAVRAASSAPRLKPEHHSEVGAQRRPPHCEPPAGTACRAAPKPGNFGRQRTTQRAAQ